jgi:protein-disulfide isomerase
MVLPPFPGGEFNVLVVASLRATARVALVCVFATALHAQGEGVATRSKGRLTAPVTIYEMSDFQCPYCRDFALNTLPALEREYIATGKVRLVFIVFPMQNIHPNAMAAAEVALCAAHENKFWPVHDALFAKQPDWAPLKDPKAYLLALADSAGGVSGAVRQCVDSGSGRDAVEVDIAAAQRTGAHSTPTFYIEGGLIEGDAPAAVFRQVLDSVYQSKTAGPAPSAR